MKRLLPVLLLSCAVGCQPETEAPEVAETIVPEPGGVGTIHRLDPRFDALVPDGAELELIASGYNWTEGPVWDQANNRLLFSDIPANAIYAWQEGDSAQLFLQPSGYTGDAPTGSREPGSNGLLFDADGRLLLAQHGDRRIARLEEDGTFTTLTDQYEGKRLNSPNDLTLASDGSLYFTDPPFGLPGVFESDQQELGFYGVYRLAPDGMLTLLTNEAGVPNGIAFSPDETTLYVTDVGERFAWLAFDVQDDGTLANQRLLYSAQPWSEVFPGAPDGLKVDAEGHLFASGPGGVFVIHPDGTLLGMIETADRTSNTAWGGDGSTLYITANSNVYRIDTTTRGAGF